MSIFFWRRDKKKDFWEWFASNKPKLEKFIDSEERDYSIYTEFTRQLHKFDKRIFPEIGHDKGGPYVLIITPDGKREGIEPTREIVASNPGFDNWEVKRFRQPKDHISMDYEGVAFESSDIEILTNLDKEAEKVHVLLCIRNMNTDERKYKTLAFLYLDHILGEFNTVTKVGQIEFKHLDPGKTARNSIDLLQLRKLIEVELY